MSTTYHTLNELDDLIKQVIARDFPEIDKESIAIAGVLKSTANSDEEIVPSMMPAAILKKRSPLYTVWSEVPAFYILLDHFIWENARDEVVGWVGNALSAMQLEQDKKGNNKIKLTKPDIVVYHLSLRKYGQFSEGLQLVFDALKKSKRLGVVLSSAGVVPLAEATEAAEAAEVPAAEAATPETETPTEADNNNAFMPRPVRRRRGAAPVVEKTPAEPATEETPAEPAVTEETPAEPATEETPAEPATEEPVPEPVGSDGEETPEPNESASTRRRRGRDRR